MKIAGILAALCMAFLTVFHHPAARTAEGELYLIRQGEWWGYMDSSGTVVIPPRFRAAQLFSEGLAAVRSGGTYGYIDRTGRMVVAPQFDFALPCRGGVAKAYINDRPYIIDTTGKPLFRHSYREMEDFGDHRHFVVGTESGKYGVVDRTGKLVADTVFSEVWPADGGIAVVTGLQHKPYSDTAKFEMGVINSSGRWVVPYGLYREIGTYRNGYAEVTLNKESPPHVYELQRGIIDRRGTLLFPLSKEQWQFPHGRQMFYEDMAVIEIYKPGNTRYVHPGIINRTGEVVASSLLWKKITPFSCNRAFAETEHGWILIDREGRQIGDRMYRRPILREKTWEYKDIFQNGRAFVETDNGYRMIDTNGVSVVAPRRFGFLNVYGRAGNILLLSKENNGHEYSGFWNTANDVVVNPIYETMMVGEDSTSLIYVVRDGRNGYINRDGREVWMEREALGKTEPVALNIDYMNRGYCYAYSEYKQELAGFGGWGGSDNASKHLSPDIPAAGEQLQMFLLPEQRTTWQQAYQAATLYVVNTAADTMYFPAEDSRLSLVLQARDSNGEWRDIEYLPHSWCGNSYHTLFLAQNEYWEFEAPLYHGGFRTKIRACLAYRHSVRQEKEELLYSNEIDGSVNPGQFWRKQEYTPAGIMDPYDE